MGEPERTVKDLVAWLERPEIRAAFKDAARTGKTAVKRLGSMREAGEPEGLGWMLEHIEDLGARLLASGLSPSTSKTYTARSISMIQAFGAWERGPEAWEVADRRFRELDVGVLPPAIAGLDAEMRDIHERLGKWPAVRDRLWPAIKALIDGPEGE